MKLDISGLTKYNGASGDVAFNSAITDLDNLVKDFSFGPVDFKGRIVNDKGILKLSGSLKTIYTTFCYRCLRKTEVPLEIKISEDFVNAAANTDNEAYTYQGGSLDIEKALKDNIILELPMKHVCSLNCRGLCPECGIDLNYDTCSCKKVSEGKTEKKTEAKVEANTEVKIETKTEVKAEAKNEAKNEVKAEANIERTRKSGMEALRGFDALKDFFEK